MIEKNEFGLVVAERRLPDMDRKLEHSWDNLMIQGLPTIKSKVINQKILSRQLNLSGKKENIVGLQMADLVVSPIGRHLIGKTEKNDWKIVKQKIWCRPNENFDGAGLVVLPKK